MDPRFLAIIPSVIVIVAICAGFMIRSFTRGWVIPRCWRCGAPKVRPSRSERFTDMVALLFLLRPVRCTGCRVRFYVPRIQLPFQIPFTKRLKPSRAPLSAHSRAARLQTQNPA
jgi:hypothetical protein